MGFFKFMKKVCTLQDDNFLHVVSLYLTSSCARSARFATCARSSLCSLCHCALPLILCGVDSASLLPHSTYMYHDVNPHAHAHYW